MWQESLLLPLERPRSTGRHALRPYQEEILRYGNKAYPGVLNGLNKHRTGIVVAPTGTGKGVCIAELCRLLEGRGLVLAESRQILRQLQNAIRLWTGEPVGLEQGQNGSEGERIVCASRQTLANDIRLERFVRAGLQWVVIDEAHHAGKREGQYQDILRRFPFAQVVGFTATPDRGDKQALEQTFQAVFFKYEIDEARRDGWLVPVVTPKLKNWRALSIAHIAKVAGELDQTALEALLATVVKEQAREGLKVVGDRKSIWYAGRVERAEQLVASIQAETGRQDCARIVHGQLDDDEKDEVIDAYRRGQFQHLVNVGICVEGFDDPPTSAVVMTSPYTTHGRFVQVCGRPLRPLCPVDAYATADGRRQAIGNSTKPNAMLVNYRYIKGKHNLVCVEDVLGGKYSDEVKARAERLRDDDDSMTVDASLERAQVDADKAAADRAEQERERQRKADLAAKAQAKTRADWGTWDPFEGRPDFDEWGQPFYETTNERPEPITEPQRRLLKYGLKVPERDIPATKKAASRLIGQLKQQERLP
jgi:superfamily II DNA or RNA helicase